jgi:hypothetical protein
VDTRGILAHGAPVKIFSKPEIQAALSLALDIGLRTTGELDLECVEKPIRWEAYGLDYTFVVFTLQKPKE